MSLLLFTFPQTTADWALVISIAGTLLAVGDRLAKRYIPRSVASVDKTLSLLKDDTVSPEQRVQLENRLSKIEARLAQYNGIEVRDRLARLEAQFAPFAKILEVELGRMFHSPHTPDVDELIEKNERAVMQQSKHDELTREEALRLIHRAKELADSATSIGERVGARLWAAALASHYKLSPQEVLDA